MEQPADRPEDGGSPRYRTAAVARMLRMPAATLRIWERRHRVAAPDTTPSGHRQYSAADVQRLALIRQLTLLGHPIGALAGLGVEQLREVASTHATALATAPETGRRVAAACRLAAIGPAAAQRLGRQALQLRLLRPAEVGVAFESVAEACADETARRVDALVVFVDLLQAPLLPQLQAVARRLGARRTALIHSFAARPMADAFAAAGIELLREPADDAVLAGWLDGLETAAAQRGRRAVRAPDASAPAAPAALTDPPPRRYDDAALADFAGLSTTIACECPRHLAQIVMQLSHFEAYSRQCRQLDAADAALHAHLGQVAATARALFESALERVAIHEGLVAR